MVHHPAVSDALGSAGELLLPDAQVVSSPQGGIHPQGLERPQNRLGEMGKIGGMAAAGHEKGIVDVPQIVKHRAAAG